MGVDARMLLVIKGKDAWLTEEQVHALSVKMSQVIGYEHFLISSEPSMYGGPAHHAMMIVGTHNTSDYYKEFVGKVAYFQDGEPKIAEEDEQFIEVGLRGRYWGPGYERGPWWTFAAIMLWIRLNIPHVAIYYGGDSSGVVAEEMTPEKIEEYSKRYIEVGTMPYRRYDIPATPFPICPFCKIELYSVGGCGAERYLMCDGCGGKFVYTPGDYDMKQFNPSLYHFDHEKDRTAKRIPAVLARQTLPS